MGNGLGVGSGQRSNEDMSTPMRFNRYPPSPARAMKKKLPPRDPSSKKVCLFLIGSIIVINILC